MADRFAEGFDAEIVRAWIADDPDAETATALEGILAEAEAGDAAAVMDPEAPPSAPGSGTYSIEARAQLDEERETVVRAVVRSGPSAVPGMAYTVLRWEHGTGTR